MAKAPVEQAGDKAIEAASGAVDTAEKKAQNPTTTELLSNLTPQVRYG